MSIFIGMDAFSILVSRSGNAGVVAVGVGAGTLTTGSVNSDHILNDTILGEDLADGIITEAKFHPTLQTNLAEFTRRLLNLEEPGWYGNFKITNANASNPFTFTFDIYLDTYNVVTNTTDTDGPIGPITLNHNQHYDFALSIGARLTNKDTQIRIEYTGSSGSVILGTPTLVGLSTDDVTSNTVVLVVSEPYIHNGNIEMTVTLDY